MVALPPPVQEAVEQMAATKDASAGAVPSRSAAVAAVAKAVRVCDAVLLIGGLQNAKLKPQCFILI